MSTFPYDLDLPPNRDSLKRCFFLLGFPTTNVIILVVTVTGWGVDPLGMIWYDMV